MAQQPDTGSYVPFRREPEGGSPPEKKGSLLGRLLAWKRGRPQEDEGDGTSTSGVPRGGVPRTLDDLGQTLGAVKSGLGEMNASVLAVRDGLETLPEVVQALPAIGRGQLSILSGMAVEQRASGTKLEESKAHLEAISGRTAELIRCTDDLAAILRDVPETLRVQGNLMGEIRDRFGEMGRRLAEVSTYLVQGGEGLRRQTEVISQSFAGHRKLLEDQGQTIQEGVNAQIVAIEGLRDRQMALASAMEETASTVAREARSASDRARRDSSRLFYTAVAAGLVLCLGFGSSFWVQWTGGGSRKANELLVSQLQTDRQDLMARVAQFEEATRAVQEQAAQESAEWAARLGELSERNDALAAYVESTRSEAEAARVRAERLANENQALRTTFQQISRRGNMAHLSEADPPAEPEEGGGD